MKNSISIILLSLYLISCSHGVKFAPQVTKKFEVLGLPRCESVVFDTTSQHYFVSVQNGQDKGDGYISKVSLTGKIVSQKFIKGLDEPKGIVLLGDKLYVSDITSLIEADLKTGKILKRYSAHGAKFLNDVEADSAGNIYVSDMFNSSIYILDTKREALSIWYDTVVLENPNGLLIDGNFMYIGAWGRFSDGNPMTSTPGRFLKVNLLTKKIISVTRSKLGHLDGVQIYDNDHFLVSDWIAGKVFLVSQKGESLEILDTEQSVGDIYYSALEKRLILPMSHQNKLMVYEIN